jgi:hypothetical protein
MNTICKHLVLSMVALSLTNTGYTKDYSAPQADVVEEAKILKGKEDAVARAKRSQKFYENQVEHAENIAKEAKSREKQLKDEMHDAAQELVKEAKKAESVWQRIAPIALTFAGTALACFLIGRFGPSKLVNKVLNKENVLAQPVHANN